MFLEDEHSNIVDKDDRQSGTEENEALKDQLHETLATENTVAVSGASERKREIMRVLVSFGILLIYGTLLCYLVPYTKHLASRIYDITPTIISQEFLLPLFWILLGWNIMQASSVAGLVGKRQSKAGRAIHITIVALIVLYVLALLPYFAESIKCMVLSSRYLKSTGSFSYTYQIPVIFQKLAYGIIAFSSKSGIFTSLGVIFWLSKPEKRQKKPKN